MRKLFALTLTALSLPLFAADLSVSGNLELQGRHSWNNEEAKELPTPVTQDWNQGDTFIFYGNLSPKVEFESSKIEANYFLRHAVSDLYREDFLAPRIYTFPNKLIARDLFKLTHRDERINSQTDSAINKLYFEKSFQKFRLAGGRLYINYGLGEIFNPVNPFNQPTGLTSIPNVAQGNDGAQAKIFATDSHTIDLLLLGDKSINDYEGEISPTAWVHGELIADDRLTIDYAGGLDQRRNKIGGQVSYKFDEAMVFGQGLYQGKDSDEDDSETLWDFMLGYDEQLNAKWHLRIESGYQKKKMNKTLNPNALGDRFLPVEYFVAFANTYEVHPLLNIGGTLISDFTTGFTYFIARGTLSLSDNIEGELFVFSPIAKGESSEVNLKDPNSLSQRLVTQDIGLALRAFF